MRIREVIDFCLLLIGTGAIELLLFNENILGFCLLLIGLIGLAGELLNIDVLIS